jgi:Phage integrase family
VAKVHHGEDEGGKREGAKGQSEEAREGEVMALFKPTYTDKKTGEQKKSAGWWFKFTYAGKPIRESAKTTRKTVAGEAEKRRRLELEQANAGMPMEKREKRIRSVVDVVGPYLTRYEQDHRGRPKSIMFANGRLKQVTRLLGKTLLSDLTEDVVRGYITTRIGEGMSGRTCNMEVGELSRAIGKPWSVLWPKVRKQEERKDIGCALPPEEEARLLESAGKRKRWHTAAVIVRALLLTGMRSGELTGAAWGQVAFDQRVLTVGRAKTSSGTGRMIPMNNDLFVLLSAHAAWFTAKFGETRPEWYLFPFGSGADDPTRPAKALSTAWDNIRKDSGVSCRLHDLRHTALTKMAEAGVPETTMLALAGHMSRAMLERYSHIRMAAKRTAVESLSITKPAAAKSDGVVQESVQVAKPAKIN